MLAEESANSLANSSFWQGCQLIFDTFFTDFFQLLVGWQPCQTEELADSSANVGFLN
jgi:hypothetical protein